MGDAFDNSFSMIGARAVAERIGVAHLTAQIDALEQAVSSSPGLAFDLAKSLVETVCKTILGDRQQVLGDSPELPALVKAVFNCVPCVPADNDNPREIKDRVQKLIQGLNTAIAGLFEIRNLEGQASHGKDAYRPVLHEIHARLVAQSADAIVHFLYMAHIQYQGSSRRALRYQDNQSFNDYVDEENAQVSIFELNYSPSQVLFELDLSAYQNYLREFQQLPEETETT